MAINQSARNALTKQISFVSDAIYPFNTGGKEMRLYEIATRLAYLGYQIDIYTMKWWDGPKDITVDGINLHALCKRYDLYAGQRRSMKQAILFGLACFKLLAINFDNIDVDHMPYFPLFSMKIVCLLKRKPLIATWHEVWGRNYWVSYLGPRLGPIAYILEYLTARLPNQIIAISEITAHKLRTELHYSGPLSVVPPGIDIEHIASIRAARKNAGIFYSGRLLDHKKIDVLLRAVALLPAPYSKVPVTIAGDGPELVRLKELAENLQLQKRVEFMGFIESHDALLAYMKKAEIFVSPSIREGFGITILEANACGTMTITSNHCDNAARFLVQEGKNGFTCASEPEELARTMIRAMQKPKSQTQQTEIANTAAPFAWPNIIARLEKVWQ